MHYEEKSRLNPDNRQNRNRKHPSSDIAFMGSPLLGHSAQTRPQICLHSWIKCSDQVLPHDGATDGFPQPAL